MVSRSIPPGPHHGPCLLHGPAPKPRRYLDEAADSRAPLLITGQNGKGDVVMLAAEEFAGWQETVHLLTSPRNAERLVRSIRQLDAGQREVHALIDDGQSTP